MLRLGWWPTWWTSILLNDAYRRGEASDEVGGRTENRGEEVFFLGGLYQSGDPWPHWHTVTVTRIRQTIIRHLIDLRSSSQGES
jgi:hypothetical protein